MGGHSGRPQWEATVERYSREATNFQKSENEESKSQDFKGFIVNGQRVNESPLIGVTRWDHFLDRIFDSFGTQNCQAQSRTGLGAQKNKK